MRATVSCGFAESEAGGKRQVRDRYGSEIKVQRGERIQK